MDHITHHYQELLSEIIPFKAGIEKKTKKKNPTQAILFTLLFP